VAAAANSLDEGWMQTFHRPQSAPGAACRGPWDEGLPGIRDFVGSIILSAVAHGVSRNLLVETFWAGGCRFSPRFIIAHRNDSPHLGTARVSSWRYAGCCASASAAAGPSVVLPVY